MGVSGVSGVHFGQDIGESSDPHILPLIALGSITTTSHGGI